MEYNFNEKTTEYYNGIYIPVFHSEKYKEAKKTAVELIQSEKYKGVVTEADFWILMNTTKAKDKMQYTGLIISHNGCLKINDKLDNPVKPNCFSVCSAGYKNSLVYTYCDEDVYEVGEVSPTNCKNEYPYAMAFKRCFDRVVLKKSKLAYAGIYSDSEADEFKEPEKPTEPPKETQDEELILCEECNCFIKEVRTPKQTLSPTEVAQMSEKAYGKRLCYECAKEEKQKELSNTSSVS